MNEHVSNETVTTDKRVQAIRDRITAAKLRVQIGMQFTMHPEVREQLRCVQSDLAVALAWVEELEKGEPRTGT